MSLRFRAKDLVMAASFDRPTYLRMAPGVSFCRVGDDHVFLDICRDRYKLIPAIHAQWFDEICRHPRQDQLSARAAALANTLSDAGILEMGNGSADALTPAPSSHPIASLDSLPHRRGSQHNILSTYYFARAAFAAASTQKLPISEQIQKIQYWRRKASSGVGTYDDHVGDLTRRFNELYRLFFTTKDACLFHSLMLIRFLCLQGTSPTLVFGIRLPPFIAHCWVQHDGCVLTDDCENVLNFQPILTV